MFKNQLHIISRVTAACLVATLLMLAGFALGAIFRVHYLTDITTPFVFTLEALLFACFWLLQRGYRRQLQAATAGEIERQAQAARMDNLTKLGNHRAYQEDIRRALQEAAQDAQSLGIALLSIDDLRTINEEYGYLHGDRILVTFADALRTVKHAQGAYRLNGNLFALILPRCCATSARKALEQLQQEVQHTLFGATISIGLTIATQDELDPSTLQAQADAALQEAKTQGKCRVVLFDDIREHTALLLPAKVSALRHLLREKRIAVHFQPIWDLQSGQILSYEALARPASDYGFAGPQEAFDIAEKIGCIAELDYICIEAILARAASLPPHTLLFINLTPQTLENGLLTSSMLLTAVLTAGLKPERVVLELTERSIVRLPVVLREIEQLKSLGFRIALDDTGSGNAGLEMLSHLPADYVKIDRSIVAHALHDKSARGVLTGIKAITRELNTYVIAEGIETVEMLECMQKLDMQGIQGYLLGRPSPSFLDAEQMQTLSPLAHQVDQPSYT